MAFLFQYKVLSFLATPYQVIVSSPLFPYLRSQSKILYHSKISIILIIPLQLNNIIIFET